MTAVKEKIKKVEKDKIREKVRLDKSYLNYHKIIDYNLPYKFSYLDEWLLKKSNKLLEEADIFNSKNKSTYRVYKRGTIIKADFGVNLGSEMSQIHFAIVLNNYDNPKNNILTVVPLTSKYSSFNLNLGTLVIDKLLNKIEYELNKKSKDVTKLIKLNTLISYYESNIKKSYACCSLITTISKTRIFPPINEYDIIGKDRCSDDVMNMIDCEIKDKFTKII